MVHLRYDRAGDDLYTEFRHSAAVLPTRYTNNLIFRDCPPVLRIQYYPIRNLGMGRATAQIFMFQHFRAADGLFLSCPAPAAQLGCWPADRGDRGVERDLEGAVRDDVLNE